MLGDPTAVPFSEFCSNQKLCDTAAIFENAVILQDKKVGCFLYIHWYTAPFRIKNNCVV